MAAKYEKDDVVKKGVFMDEYLWNVSGSDAGNWGFMDCRQTLESQLRTCTLLLTGGHDEHTSLNRVAENSILTKYSRQQYRGWGLGCWAVYTSQKLLLAVNVDTI